MDCNKWLSKWQPTQLYVMLCLSTAYFLVELFLSHTTHALTLLMDAYHMMCNIIALVACILTVKHGANNKTESADPANVSSVGNLNVNCRDQSNYEISLVGKHQENKLKNTFGWARIDVVFMLICFVFLASLSFSLVVEALQTLVHIDHHDEMHQPLIVLTVGSIGLLLNGLCYLLIGGYTFHQGSFLYVTESGNVVLDRVVSGDSVKAGGRRLSRTSRNNVPVVPTNRQRQGIREMVRDILGCVIVIITGLVVYFTNASVAKFVDPLFSIASAAMLIYLSYPYMKESCLILLQTIPDTIKIDSLKSQLLQHFPDIINIHDFHIWQLTTNKIISTVHVVFENPKVYGKLMLELKEFFADNGITQVTIQPEFYKKSISLESLASDKRLCLMSCQSEKCSSSHCCQNPDVISNNVWQSKEQIAMEPMSDQKSVKSEKDDSMLPNTGLVQRDINKTSDDITETPLTS